MEDGRSSAWRAQLDPAIWPGYVSSGARILGRRVRGHRRHPGDAATICRGVVDSCWTGAYLAASGGHFRQFWTRDLGFSAEALVALGQGGSPARRASPGRSRPGSQPAG